MNPRYPIYIISKGRSDCCLTAKFMQKEGMPFHVVVEPQETGLYAKMFGPERVYTLPFSNLGLGSIPARNWCWEHAKAAGHDRHWMVDDNIRGVWRRYKARKIRCDPAVAFRAAEDFTDRYQNIALSGFNYYMFAPDRVKMPPFWHNVHVYSCILIDNQLPYRWRGRYNEDTDLCLQVLSGGYCTVLINAFLIWKMTTMTMKGGNAAELYQGDGRLKMARSLERMWPGVVETKRRFKRPQHVIKDQWGKFDTPLKLKPGICIGKTPDEYGMKLVAVKAVEAPGIRKLLATYQKEHA